MRYFTVELWVAYDEDGNWVVVREQDDIAELWADEVGGAYMVRRIELRVPLQTIPCSVATLPPLPEGEIEVASE